MRLIDADKLYPDSVSFRGDRLCISQSQIANAPTVCDIEQIRAEIEQTADEEQKHDEKWAIGLRYAVKIIDKYKADSGK